MITKAVLNPYCAGLWGSMEEFTGWGDSEWEQTDSDLGHQVPAFTVARTAGMVSRLFSSRILPRFSSIQKWLLALNTTATGWNHSPSLSVNNSSLNCLVMLRKIVALWFLFHFNKKQNKTKRCKQALWCYSKEQVQHHPFRQSLTRECKIHW